IRPRTQPNSRRTAAVLVEGHGKAIRPIRSPSRPDGARVERNPEGCRDTDDSDDLMLSALSAQPIPIFTHLPVRPAWRRRNPGNPSSVRGFFLIRLSVLRLDTWPAVTPALAQWDGERGKDDRQRQHPQGEMDFKAGPGRTARHE